MIMYHGTPITPRAALLEMRGRHFCVSHGRHDDLVACLDIGSALMFDNGAYPAYTAGRPILDWTPYYRWIGTYLRPPHWAVVPDVIGGSVDENLQLAEAWPFPRQHSAVVWHLHEPIAHLLHLAKSWPRIAFGSSGEYWNPRASNWRRRIGEAFAALRSVASTAWIHLMRAAQQACAGLWPIASCDSTNIGRNHKGRRRLPAEGAGPMAHRLEGRNPPPWL